MLFDIQDRSFEPEILDGNTFLEADLIKNLREIVKINRLLGGHNVTLDGVKELVDGRTISRLRILDIGCGAGDTLLYLKKHLGKRYELQLCGVDINPVVIEEARRHCEGSQIEFVEIDYRKYIEESSGFDIIITTLFTHHLVEKEIVELLAFCKKARIGFVINDLHRNWVAYYLIKWIVHILPTSKMIKNDAPLSVKRGFVPSDFRQLLDIVGLTNAHISWRWAYRWLVVARTSDFRKAQEGNSQ